MPLIPASASAASMGPGPAQTSDLLIGVLVPPVLLGLLVTRGLADGLTQAGLASEQLFSGERLPNLNMPAASSAANPSAG